MDEAVVVTLVPTGFAIARLNGAGAGSDGGGVTGKVTGGEVTGGVEVSGLPYNACTPAMSPLESVAPKR
jgi:hypothetical protein